MRRAREILTLALAALAGCKASVGSAPQGCSPAATTACAACAEGAIAAACICEAILRDDGFCCGGAWRGSACGPPGGSYALPADRATAWRPGRMALGGIPSRTAQCGPTVQASSYGDGSADATAAIQAALDACPEGQVVQLSPGTFTIDDDILYLRSGVTLRGAGAGRTVLRRTNGAMDGVDAVGVAKPVVVVGQSRWTYGESSTDLAATAGKGATSISVASSAGLAAGMLVLVDELSGATWMPDPQGRGRQVWASPDWRVVWQMHDPHVEFIDDAGGADAAGPYDLDGAAKVRPPASMSWFSRTDRPIAEVHEIAAVSAGTVTLTTPLHIDYRAGGAHRAQLTRLGYPAVRGAGLEGVTVTGGDDGAVRFVHAVGCWAKNVEVATWRGEGIALHFTHRVEVRDGYVHDAAYSSPGGGAYAISIQGGSSECLVENNVIVRANKVIVARSSGAGCVVGYNFLDQGFIDYAPAWQEMGVGGSHMVGPHHMLFEGNLSFNGDNDHTHGSSTFHVYFRNHLTGFRSGFTTNTGIPIDDLRSVPGPTNGPRRCAGASAFSYGMSFVGNVLGLPGRMAGWSYEKSDADDAIWAIGWENHADLFDPDPRVAESLLRDGNFDHLTGTVHWHGIGGAGSAPAPLPDSLYLPGKPTFFGASPWPWVDPTTGAMHALPAKVRFDAGTPNEVP